MINPFNGSQLSVKQIIKEDDLPSNFNFGEKEDENERYILYTDGTLIKKTKSAVYYGPNSFNYRN